MSSIVQKLQSSIAENARLVQDQAEYQKHYNELNLQYDKIKSQYDDLEEKIADNITKSETDKHFIKTLKEQDGIVTEFSEILWGSLLDYIIVNDEKDIAFVFKNGMEIRV